MSRLVIMLTFLAVAPCVAIPPPVYDFCPFVVEVVPDTEGHYIALGSTCDGDNLVVDHDCDTWTQTYGSEDYYAIDLDPGCSFTAAVSHTGDAMLMVTAECVVFGTMFTCLRSSDSTGPGQIEALTYVNDTGIASTVYLVIDSQETSECGDYSMILSSHCPVSTGLTQWGLLKRAYE